MNWKLRSRTLDLNEPRLMGILNVTPDSFSDGGKFLEPTRALERALQMVEEGAEIVDVGGESTRPGSRPVSPSEEWSRLEPVLKLLGKSLSCPLSLDTRHGEVARRGLEEGVEIINDVSGGRDESLLQEVAQSACGYVLMHMRGVPREMMERARYGNLLREIGEEMEERYQKALAVGIAPERIARDPGFGFAKTPAQSYELLKGLEGLTSVGGVWLVGMSRKRMLRELVGEGDRELRAASVSACLLAYEKGARVFRVHDVAETALALKSYSKLAKGAALTDS